MEKVYEELDDAKAEIDKLRSEYRAKADLCDNLRRSYNEQVKKIQELNLKLEKQAQEIDANVDEMYAVNQSLEDLKSKLKEKEFIIKNLTSANDQLRVDSNAKFQKCEEEKREIVFSLEEANVKNLDLEQKNRVLMDEIEVLKEGFLSVSQKKCSDANKLAKVSKKMIQRCDMFDKVQEENVKLEEQLKWKKEQFKHLEQAHEKLKDTSSAKEKEWDTEKYLFLDEISNLENKFEDVQKRLDMCNQALTCEKGRRKCLEDQLSEFKSNIKICKLEEENQDLKTSLKELRDSQIQEASNSSSVEKLRKKLQSLKQIHRDCLSQINDKEALLEDYNTRVLQLTMEREEFAIMVVAMKSTLMEAVKSKIEEKNCDLVKEVKALRKEIEEYKDQLMHTESALKRVCDSLEKANEELDQRFCEVNEVEFERQIWKSLAEKLKVNLEENQQMRREVEASLLAQVAIEVNLREENISLIHALEEQKLKMSTLEEEFEKSTVSFSSTLAKMEAEVNVFNETFEKMKTNVILKEIEIQEKELMIEEFEKDLEKKVDFEEKCLLKVKKLSSEKEKLMSILESVSDRINKLSREDGQVMGTLRSIILSFREDRARVNDYFDPMKENTNVYQSPKRKMVGSSSFDIPSPLRECNNDYFDLVKRNMNVYRSPMRKMVESSSVDERSPLKALND